MAQTAEDAALMNRLMGNKGLLELDAFNKRAAKINAMEEGTEKERQKFILAQDYEGLKDIYGADLSSAEAMLNEQMPEGRSAGGVYVAANPLEFLSSALRQGIGASGRRNSMDKLKQLSKDYSEGIQNIMFDPGNQQGASPNTAPIQTQDTQAQKPDYRQYGYGEPLVNAGATILSGRDIPPHVEKANDRRAARAEAGLPVGERGTGPIGQAKQAAGITPRSEALRAMGGMGKPDLSRYGAPDIGAGMGQQTERVPAIPFGAGVRPDQLTEQKQSLAKSLFGSSQPDVPPTMAEDRKSILEELMSRRNLRGY